MATGDCVATLEGHTSYVRSVCVSPDNARVVSGSDDKTVKVCIAAKYAAPLSLLVLLSPLLACLGFDNRP